MLRALRDGIVPYWQIARLLPAVSGPLSAAVSVGVVVGAALPVAATVVTGTLVGSIPAAVAAGADSDAARSAFRALAVVGALFVLARAVDIVRGTLTHLLARRLNEHLRERVMVALNRPIGVAHLEDPALHDQIERAQGSASGFTAGTTVGPLANMAAYWLQSIGSALVLARFSPPLAVGLLVVWAVAAHYLRAEYVQSARQTDAAIRHSRRAGYLRDLALTPGAGKELRVWSMLHWLTDRFTEQTYSALQSLWRERDRGDRVHIAATLGSQVVTFGVVAALGLAASRAAIGLAELATYLGAVIGVQAINNWGEAYQLAYGTTAVPAVLALERSMMEAERSAALHGTVLPSSGAAGGPGGVDGASMPREGIRFEGVVFCYTGRSDAALKDLDLFIPAGKSLAIVGANGAGKTTLVKLLARLYDPTAGRISVDGVPLDTIEPRAWQRCVAAIMQDFVQYHLTARDNVVFGAPERANDAAALEEAARRTGALELVQALPRGWDTVLSRQYTGGADLSGGQWQRLALARALFAVAAGASVLVLDEPTANLDVRAEAALYDRFLDITQGLTTLVISHRFSTVRRADRIVVLEHGRVVEEGTHGELMDLRGRYAEMFTLQASRFTLEEQPSGTPGSTEPAGV